MLNFGKFKRGSLDNKVESKKPIGSIGNLRSANTISVDDINSYVGKVVVRGDYTQSFKHIVNDDTYSILLNEDIDFKVLLNMLCSYLNEKDVKKAILEAMGMERKFNWLTRDMLLLAYINKVTKLGMPKIEMRHNNGKKVIPSVIMCSREDERRFIAGYIVHHGLSYDMQEIKYGDNKAYAPYSKPLESNDELCDIVHHLNYQYTLLY